MTRVLRRTVLSAVLVGVLCAPAARAESLGAPASARLGDAATLVLQGAALPDRDYRAVAEPRSGRPCPSAWERPSGHLLGGDVRGGRVRVPVVSRTTRVCLYRVRITEEGETVENVLAGERAFDVPFTALPRVPLTFSAGTRALGRREPSVGFALDTRGRTRAVRISPGTPRAYGQLQCSRKRFLFPRSIDMSGWDFKVAASLVTDNTGNYDTPIPPRYAGRARATLTGRVEYVRAGELRLVVRLRFAAPGLRGAPGTPPCPRVDATLRGQIEVPVSG